MLALDARNHGSSPHSPLMSYEAMSVDVQQLLTHLGITKCILLGHSMGGKTAMTLALQRVGRRRALGLGARRLRGLLEQEAVGRGVALGGVVHQCQPCPRPHSEWLFSTWSVVLSRSEW